MPITTSLCTLRRNANGRPWPSVSCRLARCGEPPHAAFHVEFADSVDRCAVAPSDPFAAEVAPLAAASARVPAGDLFLEAALGSEERVALGSAVLAFAAWGRVVLAVRAFRVAVLHSALVPHAEVRLRPDFPSGGLGCVPVAAGVARTERRGVEHVGSRRCGLRSQVDVAHRRQLVQYFHALARTEEPCRERAVREGRAPAY